MLDLIERIRSRLGNSAYVNEAAISHGIVTPILNALGWDSADPDQLVPEYTIPERGRVDFALLGLGGKPAVFIEVKGVGRALDGDRQLFEYSFHHGVPLCVLTDGREWSFYVPAGQGSYDDRRVYRLQLDDRDTAECERVLDRYLARTRVHDGSAFEDAQRDYKDAAGKRAASATLPRAWAALVTTPEELLIDLISRQAEVLCGYRPSVADAATFLQRLKVAGNVSTSVPQSELAPRINARGAVLLNPKFPPVLTGDGGSVHFTIFGQTRRVANAKLALIDILRTLASRDATKVDALAEAVRGRSRSLIARSVEEINPARPDLARAAEFAPGWLVGLNTSNREKMSMIRLACDIYQLKMPEDLDISLPNA